MKFAQLIAVTTAVRLSQREGPPKGPGGPPPTPADIIEECDADENGALSKKEVFDCIQEHIKEIPEEYRPSDEEVHAEIDDAFGEADQDGDGEVDEHELSEAMRAHDEEMKEGPPKGSGPAKELAKILKKKKKAAKELA